MARRCKTNDFKEIINKERAQIKNFNITTDIIVGFPGETDSEFRGTLKLMELVGFDNSYMFSYSPRPGTPASELEDDVSELEKRDRLQETIKLQKEITSRNGLRYVGQKVNILIEEVTTRNGANFKGRTPHYWMVNCKGGKDRFQPGDQVEVLVKDHKGHVLVGSCIN